MNLFRNQPPKYVTKIKDLKRLMPEEFAKETDLINKVCDDIKNMAPLRQITFKAKALEAVRKNNKQVVELDEEKPMKGGNVKAYEEMEGTGTALGEEYTVFNWKQSAQHLVAYILVMHYKGPEVLEDKEKNAEAEEQNKDKEDAPAKPEKAKLHPLIDPNCSHLGVSFMGHKKCENAT